MGPIRIMLEPHPLTRKISIFALADDSSERRCWIEESEKLYIDPGRAGDSFPVYIQFEAKAPIVGVGFSKDVNVKEHSDKGNCGECFFLECGIDPTSLITPLIRNEGPGASPPTPYHFELWLAKGDDSYESTGVDPQIYNQGIGESPGWWRKLLAFLQRL